MYDSLPKMLSKCFFDAILKSMQVAKNISIPFHEIDAHNVIPTWISSDKRETGARTIRSKIHKKLPEWFVVILSYSWPEIPNHHCIHSTGSQHVSGAICIHRYCINEENVTNSGQEIVVLILQKNPDTYQEMKLLPQYLAIILLSLRAQNSNSYIESVLSSM